MNWPFNEGSITAELAGIRVGVRGDSHTVRAQADTVFVKYAGRLSAPWVTAWIFGISLLGVAVWWHTSKSFDKNRVYRIGYEPNPPFQIQGDDGRPRGIAVDTVSVAAKRAGIQLQWILDTSRTAESLRTKQVDLWPLMTDTKERRKIIHFSDPWIISDNYLIARGASSARPAGDFDGAIRFAGPKVFHTLITRIWPKAKTEELPDPALLPEPMCRGTYPYVLASAHQANNLMRALLVQCPKTDFRAHHLAEVTGRLGVASTFEAAGVAERLHEEILAMAEDDELGGILAKYAYVGLTETRAILSQMQAERQSGTLSLALSGLVAALALLCWVAWHLRHARTAADAASAAKSEFLAKMSHEIRTPMGGVIGMIELTLDEPLSAAQKDYLQTAHSSARALLAILNDILDFSRIEAGRLDITPADVALRDLVNDVARLMTPVARGKGLNFETAVADNVPAWIRTDPVRVKQILLNLVGNSVKFTERGWVRIHIQVTTDPVPTLLFQVSDTGIGIAAGKHATMFEPFVQADGSTVRKFGGSGLGLAISKQLVGMMGGRIWFESSPGTGSVFSFTTPAITAAQGAAPPVIPMHDLEPASALCILVAEDNRVNQKLIRGLLERDGHHVTIVGTGLSAVSAIQNGGSFDLVLMDIQMPEMDGFEATAVIRALPGVTDRCLPIVALTAHAQVGFGAACMDAGMNAYLTKPIEIDALRQVLARYSRPVLRLPLEKPRRA